MSAAGLALLLVLGAASPEPTPAPAPAVAAGDEEPGPQDLPAGDCFSPGQAESRLVVPQTRIERFGGPVVDIHSHAYAETPN